MCVALGHDSPEWRLDLQIPLHLSNRTGGRLDSDNGVLNGCQARAFGRYCLFRQHDLVPGHHAGCPGRVDESLVRAFSAGQSGLRLAALGPGGRDARFGLRTLRHQLRSRHRREQLPPVHARSAVDVDRLNEAGDPRVDVDGLIRFHVARQHGGLLQPPRHDRCEFGGDRRGRLCGCRPAA